MRDNAPMLSAYVGNAARLGRALAQPSHHQRVVGSTDMGNISYLVPSIHPIIKVAPAGVPIHSPEFAAHAASEEADLAVLDGAKAMAMTVVDLWVDAGLLDTARTEFTTATGAPPAI
jgi:metal-dependent amidase/aminoacylase/carboxypeptidase family protein